MKLCQNAWNFESTKKSTRIIVHIAFSHCSTVFQTKQYELFVQANFHFHLWRPSQWLILLRFFFRADDREVPLFDVENIKWKYNLFDMFGQYRKKGKYFDVLKSYSTWARKSLYTKSYPKSLINISKPSIIPPSLKHFSLPTSLNISTRSRNYRKRTKRKHVLHLHLPVLMQIDLQSRYILVILNSQIVYECK